jgi:tryptophan synthase alpha chain
VNRIDSTFERLKTEGRTGLVAYLTAGDPDLAASEENFRIAVENGADVLEVGIPFSDPTADGPTIQAAGKRALDAGMTVAKGLELVQGLRRDIDTPIVLFGYSNTYFAYGYDQLCKDAVEAGADGVLVVDIPAEEADEFTPSCHAHGLHFVPLIAPTTPPDRAARILAESNGFVYYIMVTGVTGARASVSQDVRKHVDRLRQCTELPIGVGFGVSSAEQAREVAAGADAVVVGSALVEAAMHGKLADLTRELRSGLDSKK